MPPVARRSRSTWKRLGDLLREDGLLDRDQLYAALHEQRQTGEMFIEVLIRTGVLDEQAIAQSIVKSQRLPFISLKRCYISKEVSEVYPAQLLRQYLFVPLDRMGPVLTIVAGSPPDANAISELERLGGCRVYPYIGLLSEVKETIDSAYPQEEDDEGLSSLGNLLLGDE